MTPGRQEAIRGAIEFHKNELKWVARGAWFFLAFGWGTLYLSGYWNDLMKLGVAGIVYMGYLGFRLDSVRGYVRVLTSILLEDEKGRCAPPKDDEGS